MLEGFGFPVMGFGFRVYGLGLWVRVKSLKIQVYRGLVFKAEILVSLNSRLGRNTRSSELRV